MNLINFLNKMQKAIHFIIKRFEVRVRVRFRFRVMIMVRFRLRARFSG